MSRGVLKCRGERPRGRSRRVRGSDGRRVRTACPGRIATQSRRGHSRTQPRRQRYGCGDRRPDTGASANHPALQIAARLAGRHDIPPGVEPNRRAIHWDQVLLNERRRCAAVGAGGFEARHRRLRHRSETRVSPTGVVLPSSLLEEQPHNAIRHVGEAPKRQLVCVPHGTPRCGAAAGPREDLNGLQPWPRPAMEEGQQQEAETRAGPRSGRNSGRSCCGTRHRCRSSRPGGPLAGQHDEDLCPPGAGQGVARRGAGAPPPGPGGASSPGRASRGAIGTGRWILVLSNDVAT